jgi:hypothetical protein
MAMTVSITCDGCDLTEETSTSFDAGANEIEAQLEEGWSHSSNSDYCPKGVAGGGLDD